MPDHPTEPESSQPSEPPVVLDSDGHPVAGADRNDQSAGQAQHDLTSLVEQPAKVMRIGSMIKQLLDEVKEAPLDAASRQTLATIHERSVKELQDGLAPELVAELERLSLPFDRDSEPSDAELRIAQAQLVGWLEGLFHGIQTTMFAQQMSARAQFEEMRRRAIGSADPEGSGHNQPSGPYL